MNPKSLESTIPHLVYIRVSRDALAFTSDDIEKTAMLIAEDNAHESVIFKQEFPVYRG